MGITTGWVAVVASGGTLGVVGPTVHHSLEQAQQAVIDDFCWLEPEPQTIEELDDRLLEEAPDVNYEISTVSVFPDNFPKWVLDEERLIIGRLITAILDRDLTISVYDGEEFSVNKSRDRALIERETAATCETYYILFDDKQVQRGAIWLIHGNGEDVISDHTDNEICGELCDAAMRG